jgi:hypothetical protein
MIVVPTATTKRTKCCLFIVLHRCYLYIVLHRCCLYFVLHHSCLYFVVNCEKGAVNRHQKELYPQEKKGKFPNLKITWMFHSEDGIGVINQGNAQY